MTANPMKQLVPKMTREIFQRDMNSGEQLAASPGEIILYQPDETVRLEVRLENDTVWLNRQQLATLFDRDVKTIGKHISNALKEELRNVPTVAKFAIVQTEGSRRVTRMVEFYSLDMVISVGYRVKSEKGIEFRIWANHVLKEYLLRGYSVNYQMRQLEQKIDNYVDDTVLTMLDKRAKGVTATIYTQHIGQQFRLDIERHNAQYAPITVKHFNRAHDRFMLIDDEVYHIGASLKDLGRKWFAFTLMHDITTQDLMQKL